MQKHKGNRKFYYLDNAAATPIDSQVLSAMNKAAGLYGNPSSFNNAGRAARAEIEKSRQAIAAFLGARPDEIVFMGSGSEANNLAILGSLSGLESGTVLTTLIEHRSILEPLRRLALKIKYISVDQTGLIDLKEFERLLGTDCRMVSVMYANNEIGTIEPIKKISRTIKAFNKKYNTKILFHVDACQATLFLEMNVQNLGVDFLSFDGCKIYGPHGVGGLYIRKGTVVQPLIVGAGQEHGLKAGTENIQNIVGLAEAISLIQPAQGIKISALRDYAIGKLRVIPEVMVNGPAGDGRLPNNINLAVAGLTSEVLLLELDKHGIYAGSGSACTSHGVEPSRVLKAIGVPASHINGALRFSLGRATTKKDIDYLVKTLVKIIPQLAKRYARLR